jgi:hypothetical protein
MRVLSGCLTLCAAGWLVLLTATTQGGEKAEKIAPDKLPKKIKAAVEAKYPGAKVTSAEKEKEGGKVVYDIELKYKGKKYEMDILADGTIIEIEKEVAIKKLPKAVRKALDTRFPKGTFKEAMKVYKVKGKKETLDHYEITLVPAPGARQREVVVSLDGKTIKGGEAEAGKKKDKAE